MDVMSRIEQSLAAALARGDHPGCPPRLTAAMRYAVFPRGARIRPRLCLSVAAACGDDRPDIADSAAAAIELLHCASLIHDDLPCFDDADIRRGRPSVHRAFGEPLAVLAGDALIVLAFQTLAQGAMSAPARLPALLGTIGLSVGIPCGIVAGQAWECEQDVDLAQYQREKTGALFAAATVAGAAAAGGPAECWREVGMRLGEAFQVADDILDATGNPEMLGKPAGQDCAHARPSAVLQLGLDGAIARLEDLSGEAVEAVPPCPGRLALRSHIRTETLRLLPQELARHAA
ncbi:polyprenyl synthetase family protein [Acidisphaera sp. L21]|uniref:polyprenyl synthetase family protein n=1 Tax=Acidisphaera sp. L21 TaxID=1641851 RepID=UPI00131BBE47|nr:polyprenyl synthetase family protein [Acidisphaera sp. L21]